MKSFLSIFLFACFTLLGETPKDRAGEDRFHLKLSTGEELIITLLRKIDGCFDIQSTGEWIDAKGKSNPLAIEDLSVISREKWKSSKTGIVYPSKWEVRIRKFKVDVKLEPTPLDQEVQNGSSFSWKGACNVSGSHSGRAQVELTGYGKEENGK
jgi:predicted secreted hydrolase